MEARRKKLLMKSAAILCVGCAYAVFCSLTHWGIPCPFHLVTGLNCPGCGVSRMLLSLLRLDLRAAFGYNAALLCLLPVFLLLFLAHARRYVRDGSYSLGRFGRGTELVLAFALVLWGLVRNLIGM